MPPFTSATSPGFAGSPGQLRILLVEDQAMFRGLIRIHLAALYPDAAFVEVATVAELDQINAADFDLALVDLELGDGTSLAWIHRAAEQSPRCSVVILSSVDPQHEALVFRAAQAGVAGFVHKNEDMQILVSAVKTVIEGGMYYSPLVNQMRRSLAKPDFFNKILSEREQTILGYIGEGMTNDEIAQLMGLKSRSVVEYRKKLMGKLDMHSATELMKYAIDMGFTKL